MGLITTLALDIAASWARLFVALAVSILFSIYFGIEAATNPKMEKIILPLIDVLQTIPILGFFPVVIYLIVLILPGSIGVNAAVVFLIFTSMAWNITFGVYESVKSIPQDLLDLAKLNQFSTMQLYKDLYIPASMPRIAYQSVISWSIGLFYLVTSEIFATGSANFSVSYGIGVAISNLVLSSNTFGYVIAIVMFIVAVVLTRVFFLHPLSLFSERFSFKEDAESVRSSRVLRAYSLIGSRLKRAFYPAVARLVVAPGKRVHNTAKFAGKIATWPIRRYLSGRERAKINAGIARLILLVLLIIAILIGFTTGITSYLPEVVTALAYSFVRVWLTYIVCAVIAVLVGVWAGLSKKLSEPMQAIFQVVSSIPATILLPAIVAMVMILPFTGEITAFIIIFISMFWYLLFSVISGITTIPKQLIDLKNMSRLTRLQAWRDIYIPAILPSFITGSVTAIGGAWNALIVAEYFTVQSSSGTSLTLTQVGTGIGKTIDTAVFSGNLALALLSIIVITAMVIVINKYLWQRLYSITTSKYKVSA